MCAWALTQPILVSVMGLASITTQGVEAGPIQFEIEEDHEGIEGYSDFED